MNLKFWKIPFASAPAPERRIEVVRRPAIKLRLGEWRSDPALVAEARKVFAQDSFQIMLDVLRNENPSAFCMAIGTKSDDRAVMQSRGEGYQMAIANLEAMTEPIPMPQPIEAEFEPEEVPTNK